jgi:tRNA threonylcarbamoyl adenosine modification protein YeaZ
MSATILAIDCATGPSSVAVWQAERVVAYLEEKNSAMQSTRLMPMIEEALSQSGLRYGDLSLVACTTGPGSFTGIRVALAAARGVCFASGVKGAGFTTLETLAFAARNDKPVLAVLNAGKGEFYYQGFSAEGRALCEPLVGGMEDALAVTGKDGVIAGNSGQTPPGYEVAAITWPRADALAALAAVKEGGELTPCYIRLPDAKLPSKAFLL